MKIHSCSSKDETFEEKDMICVNKRSPNYIELTQTNSAASTMVSDEIKNCPIIDTVIMEKVESRSNPFVRSLDSAFKPCIPVIDQFPVAFPSDLHYKSNNFAAPVLGKSLDYSPNYNLLF